MNCGALRAAHCRRCTLCDRSVVVRDLREGDLIVDRAIWRYQAATALIDSQPAAVRMAAPVAAPPTVGPNVDEFGASIAISETL